MYVYTQAAVGGTFYVFVSPSSDPPLYAPPTLATAPSLVAFPRCRQLHLVSSPPPEPASRGLRGGELGLPVSWMYVPPLHGVCASVYLTAFCLAVYDVNLSGEARGKVNETRVGKSVGPSVGQSGVGGERAAR